MRRYALIPLTLAVCLLLLYLFSGCGPVTIGSPLDSGTQIDPATLSVKDLRLVATKTYNRLFDYHVAKSRMSGLTDQEKRDLNALKAALDNVYGPLTEFQMMVDNNMAVSTNTRDKILIFLDHWMYKYAD